MSYWNTDMDRLAEKLTTIKSATEFIRVAKIFITRFIHGGYISATDHKIEVAKALAKGYAECEDDNDLK